MTALDTTVVVGACPHQTNPPNVGPSGLSATAVLWGARVASNQSWIKLHTDMLYDPKILRLHPIGRFAWVGLLLMARGGDPAGTWQARSREAVAQDLACVLRLDDALDDDPTMDHVASAVIEWERSGMVTIDADGLVTVTKWEKRQGSFYPSALPEQTRERQRLSRMSRDVTSVSRAVTTGHDRVEEKRVEESRSETTQPMRSKRARRTDASEDPEFETFWNAYPPDRRRGKFEALQAWRQLGLSADDRAQVMTSLERWKGSGDWLKDAGKYIPWPQKFLRKRRWQESPDAGDWHDPDALPPLRLA